MAGSARVPAFEDDYVTEFPELDDWDKKLQTAKRSAKRVLDKLRDVDIVGEVKTSEIYKAQQALTILRTRAALSLLEQFEDHRAPPDMYQRRATLARNASLIQHYCTHQGFNSTMQLEWKRDAAVMPTDWDTAKGFILSLLVRYQQHLNLTRKQFERLPGDVHGKIIKQLELLTGGLSRACDVRSAQVQSILKGGASFVRPPPVHPDEGDITYDSGNRSLFYAKLDDRGQRDVEQESEHHVSLQVVTAHRRKSHRAMTENAQTAEFYNKVIAPKITPWVEVEVVLSDLTVRIKVSDFCDADTSVVYPFIAIGNDKGEDFRDNGYVVHALPAYVMQGIPNEINSMKQVCLLSNYVQQVYRSGVNGYVDYSKSAVRGLIRKSPDRILNYARAYYSVEDRQKGDTAVYFLQYGGVVVGVQVFTPDIRHLWYERSQHRQEPGGLPPTPQFGYPQRRNSHIQFAGDRRRSQSPRRGQSPGRYQHPQQQQQQQHGGWQQHPHPQQQQHGGWQQQARRGEGNKRGEGQFINPQQVPAPPPPRPRPAPSAPRPRPAPPAPQPNVVLVPPRQPGQPAWGRPKIMVPDLQDGVVASVSQKFPDAAPERIQLVVNSGNGVFDLDLENASLNNIVYRGARGDNIILQVVNGVWVFVGGYGDRMDPFIKQVNPHHLDDVGSTVWTKHGGMGVTIEITMFDGDEVWDPNAASTASTATLPYQPRRLASRPGADWRPSVESDLQHVMASLEEIKRALNDAQLLKDVLTA